MFKKKLIALPALLLGLTLASCQGETGNSTSSDDSSQVSSSTPVSSGDSSSSSSSSTEDDFTQGSMPYAIPDPTFDKPVGTRSAGGILAASNGNRSLVQSGEENLLVVPVQFLDDSQQYTSTQIDSLTDFFFGAEDSISSYYSTVSQNKLSLGGTVGPVDALTLPSTLDTYLSQVSVVGATEVLSDITEYVVESLFTSPITRTLDWRDFDADGDGAIDAISLVFIHDAADSSTTDTSEASFLSAGLVNSPLAGEDIIQVGSVSWAPYEYTEGTYTDGIYEALIGSMLGIPTLGDQTGNSTTSTYRYPMGYSDVMDSYYLTDQSSFAKYLMGWISPEIYTAEDIASEGTQITLRPSESTGDAIILSVDGSDSPFGEYLIVDFYTPTGYNSNLLGKNTMTAPGIRVLKVDSRLVREQNSHWYLYDGEPELDSGAAYDYAYTNSSTNSHTSDGITSNFTLCSILGDDASNRHVTGDSPVVTSDLLFQEGEGFGDGDVSLANKIFYGNFAFDGTGNPATAPTLGITFTVDSIGSDSATITLRRSN